MQLLQFIILLSPVFGAVFKEEVCRSNFVDIRNDPSSISALPINYKTCTVLEGSFGKLQKSNEIFEINSGINILMDMMHMSNWTQIDDPFPVFENLVEITGHLRIYKTIKLMTLRNIFPNLRVIRGRDLILNYAFAVYRNTDLKDISLPNLRAIYGGVRIAENEKLCYVESIDFKDLVRSDGDILIESNHDKCANSICKVNDETKCVSRPRKSDNDRKLPACWDEANCQVSCSPTCGEHGCRDGSTTECCHEQCVGGCKGPGAQSCYACMHVRHKDECLETCPPGLYLDKRYERRCVTLDACKNISATMKAVAFNKDGMEYLECSVECPSGYQVDEHDPHKCNKCDGDCPKKCKKQSVTSIQDMSYIAGCNIIEGSLRIELQARSIDNFVDKLTKALQSVQVVTEYVRIAFVDQLYSLNMLSNLTEIGGKGLYKKEYALIIMGNENLREINLNPKLKISNGKVMVQNNAHLCYDKIKAYFNTIHKNFTEADVPAAWNGHQETCTQDKLDLTVKSGEVFHATWSPFNDTNNDHRKFLGYILYYKVVGAPGEVKDIYANRDACSDTWKTLKIDSGGDSEESADVSQSQKEVTEMVIPTVPNAWYAFYVKTTVVASQDVRGAISDVVYAKSSFSEPKAPTKLEGKAEKEGELTFEWKPPLHPNGEITHYRVVIRRNEDTVSTEVDYCTDEESDETKHSNDNKNRNGNAKADCDCVAMKNQLNKYSSKMNENIEDDESGNVRDRSERALFQDVMMNYIYFQDPNGHRQNGERRHAMNDTRTLQDIEYQHNAQYRKPGVSGQNARQSSSSNRKKRSIASSDPHNHGVPPPTAAPESVEQIPATTVIDGASLIVGSPITKNITTLRMKLINLHHYSDYHVEVYACQNQSVIPNFCSSQDNVERSIITMRTRANVTKNKINETTVEIQPVVINTRTDNNTALHAKSPVITNLAASRFVKWTSPEDPNGPVLRYQIDYKDVTNNGANVKQCVSVHEYLDNEGGFVLINLHPADYTLTIRAISLGNIFGPPTHAVKFTVIDDRSYAHIWIIIGTLIGLLILATLVGAFIYRSHKKKMDRIKRTLGDWVEEDPEFIQLYKPDKWELNRNDIELLSQVGHGTFGTVYHGRGKDLTNVRGVKFGECAVKCVRGDAKPPDRYMFLQEANIMKEFDTNHVVALYGVVSDGQPALVVMEFYAHGNLRDYLRSRRPNFPANTEGSPPPTLQQIYLWAAQIADGMAYLEMRKFVHRDLACRNCLLNSDLVVKIGDFGMARDVYTTAYYKPIGKRMSPVRWMPPEALIDARFSTKSDVWAYGVVIWEMVTLGHQPYPGIDNADISTFVFAQRGNMVNTERFRPIGCPKNLLRLMEVCWAFEAENRPAFAQIAMSLLPKTNADFKKVAFITTQYKEQKGDTIADTTVFEDDSAASFVPATIRDSTSYARNSSTSAGATDDSITEKEKRQRQQWTLMSGGDTSEIELPVDNDEIQTPVCQNKRRSNMHDNMEMASLNLKKTGTIASDDDGSMTKPLVT